MAFENIISLADQFDRSLTKIAAKEKTSKKSLSKRLEKARAEHQKLSEEFKRVQKEFDKIKSVYDDLKGKVSAKRKEIIFLQNAGQKMDLADASDAIFHQDTNDVSYVIDGKEFHVELDGDGNVNTVPWRDHRKAQKPVEPEMTEGMEEATDEVSNAEDCADPPGEQDAANMDQAMLDDLYLKMTEEKMASYLDLIKKWGKLFPDIEEIKNEVLKIGQWVGNLWSERDSLSFLNELKLIAQKNQWFLYCYEPKKEKNEILKKVVLSIDPPEFEPSLKYTILFDPTEEKTASYSDLIKKWGADQKEWIESSLLSGDWYKSLGDKVDSFHEDDVPEDLANEQRTETNWDWPEFGDDDLEEPNDEELNAGVDEWEERNFQREHESEWHPVNQCPGKGCRQKHPRGTEPTESSYDPMIDSKLEEEKVLESEGKDVEGWPEFDENLSDDKKFSNIRDAEADAEYDGSEYKKTALKLFIAAERAEKKADVEYHNKVPKEEKSQERYSKWMTPYWKDSQEAYELYHSLGGRLGG